MYCHPVEILDVRYEDVVADLEIQARRIISHCGLAPQVKPQEAPQPPAAGFDLDRELVKLSADMRQSALEKQVEGLTAEVDAARTYIDRQHFEAAATAIEKRLSDFGLLVPAGYVKNALMAAAHNPEIAQAFDNRGQNPAAYTRAMRKLQDRIVQDAKSMPDPQATGDKLAVVAAMRSATTRAPQERPPDYGAMNDAEFAKVLAKHNL